MKVELWELGAREQIRDTIYRYNHAGDRGRATELAAQFTDDGVLEIFGSGQHAGHEAIVGFISGVSGHAFAVRANAPVTPPPTEPPLVRHCLSNLLIRTITPERAEVDTYFVVYTRKGLDHCGRYRDVLVPSGDRWLIQHRIVRTDAHW